MAESGGNRNFLYSLLGALGALVLGLVLVARETNVLERTRATAERNLASLDESAPAPLQKVRANPNSPNPSFELIRNLDLKMKGALQSEDAAETLFKELDECVSASNTLKLICASKADQLSARYPARFAERNRAIQSRVSQSSQN